MAPGYSPFYYVDESLVLSMENSRHFTRVLRKGAGDIMEISDGKGRSWQARALLSESGVIRAERVSACREEPQPFLRLACAVAKGQRMAYLVEKSAELGVRDIQPILCQHASVRNITDGMLRRWRAIALSGSAQSRSPWICSVLPPVPLEKLLRSRDCVAVLDPAGEEKSWSLLSQKEEWTILVGPEGGWSGKERAYFQENSIPLLPLMKRILRIETAAAAAVATYYALN
jgi:16S rRNA (uracil1498-N3)-methyltransferase